jgi:type IV secretion system protein VirB10
MNRISQGGQGGSERDGAGAGDSGPLAADGVRGMPDLRAVRRRTNVSRFWIALIAFAVLAVVAGSVAVFVKRLGDQHMQAREDARNAPKESSATTSGHDFGVDKDRVAREKAEAARQASLALAATAPLPVPVGAMGMQGMQPVGAMQPGVSNGPIAVAPVGGMGTGGGTPVAVARDTGPTVESVADRRFDGDVLVKLPDDHGTGSGSTPHGGGATSAPGLAAPAAPRSAPGGFDERLSPSTLASAKATHLPA